MTQEIFYKFAQHFIEHLPPNKGPVLLVLDGHGSRWSVPALRLLMDNQVYPFFLASHTSIWSQPNDCGCNVRLHNCLERGAAGARRFHSNAPKVQYFNAVFSDGWRLFLDLERDDLLNTSCNNTTNAYERTGIYPFDPECSAWTEAIESLGLASTLDRDEKRAVQYEIRPKVSACLNVLNDNEKKLLRRDIHIDKNNYFTDVEVAKLVLENLLKAWREKIHEMVREGGRYSDCAACYSPDKMASTPGEKIALLQLEFYRPDFKSAKANQVTKTKEEKVAEFSRHMVDASPDGGFLQVSVQEESNLPPTLAATPTTAATTVATKTTTKGGGGLAVKLQNGRWNILLKNGEQLIDVCADELLYSGKFVIEGAALNISPVNLQKQGRKNKRRRQQEESKLKARLQFETAQLREQNDLEEFTKMKEMMKLSEFGEKEYLAMLARRRAPFHCCLEGRDIVLTDNTATLVMKNVVMGAIATVLVPAAKKRSGNENENTTNKKRRTGGTAAVGTGSGADGITALHQASRRDNAVNKNEREKKKRALVMEEKATRQLLVDISERRKNFNAVDNTNCDENLLVSLNQNRRQDYWSVRENEVKKELLLFLRMFVPKSGLEGKKKDIVWAVLVEKVLPTMSQAQFVAKEEALTQRLACLEVELQQIQATASMTT